MPRSSPSPDRLLPASAASTVRIGDDLPAANGECLLQLLARLELPDANAWSTGLAAAEPDPATATPLDRWVRAVLLATVSPAADRLAAAPMSVDRIAAWGLLRAKVPALADRCGEALERARRSGAERPIAVAAPLPQSVGHYDLGELLGEGSSGSVFRARDRRDGRAAAVKVLRVAWASHEQVARFRRESQITAGLLHPGIVRVLDSGVEGHAGLSTPFIAYELVAGRPFVEAMAGQPLVTVLTAFQRVCEAIEYAHGRGILHRDIKSANVLVDAGGMPHVLDFGLAMLLGDEGARMTRTGEVLGTLVSMSPEQASARPLDARSDVYSLGAMLFEALTGESPHPLEGLRDREALVVVASSPARPLARVRGGIAADVATVVDTALAFVAADRYPSVTALLADVRRLLQRRPIVALRPTAWHLLRTFVARHRRWAMAGAAIAGGTVLLTSALFVAWRQSIATTVATAAAERSAREAVERCRVALRVVIQVARPNVEAAPSQGAMHDQLMDLLEHSLDEAKSGLGEDAEAAEVFASLHELAGDLAWRGGRGDIARRHREQAVRWWPRAGAAHVLDHAQAIVKLGDVDLQVAPAIAGARYEQAHAMLLAEAAVPGASVRARDDLGWSYERLGGFAWSHGRREATFGLAQQRLALAEALLRGQPDAERHFHLASALAHLIVYSREEPALSPFPVAQRRAFAERASVAALAAQTEHPTRRPFLDLAVRTHDYLATECRDAGDFAAERAALLRAVMLADRLLQQDPCSGDALRLSILAHHDLGRVSARLGDAFAGERELGHAADLGERALLLGGVGGMSPDVVAAYRSAARQLHGDPVALPAPVPR